MAADGGSAAGRGAAAQGGAGAVGGIGGVRHPGSPGAFMASPQQYRRAIERRLSKRLTPEEEARESAGEALRSLRRVHLRVLSAEATPGLSALDDDDLCDEEDEATSDEGADDDCDDGEGAAARAAKARQGAGEDDDCDEGAPKAKRSPRVRGRTISIKRLSKRELERGRLLYPEAETEGYGRPSTRGDCLHGAHAARPCPYVSCKHHLYLDVNERTGSIKVNFPDVEVWEMPETCALDVADRGGITLEEVGEVMNLTRERIRQVENRAMARLSALADVGRKILDGIAVAEDVAEAPAAHAMTVLADTLGAVDEARRLDHRARGLTRVRGVRAHGV